MNKHRAWRFVLAAALTLALVACGPSSRSSGTPSPAAVDDDSSPAADLLPTARALADTWIASYSPETMGWSWDSGLLMLGIWDLWELTQDASYHDYVKAWMDYQLGVGYFIAYNDHVPPARLALRLWQETGEAKYRQPVDDAKSYIFERAPRLTDGALVHMGWQTPDQIWVDTLYMITPFLAEAGAADRDAACWNEAVLQFTLFAKHLRDLDTGLYRHRYDQRTNALTPPVEDYWGRGNAWVVAASGVSLHWLPPSTTGLAGVLSRLDEQLTAMAGLQRADNRWTTIMNRAATYPETSVGALVAYGIYEAAAAKQASDAQLTLADKALRGALDQVVVDAAHETMTLGTSYGTAPSTWEMYNYVLKGEQVDYGVGAILLAIAARANLGRTDALPAAHATPETYISPPTGADPATWGWFYVARGNFDAALKSFDQAIGADAEDPEAQLGVALIGGVRFAMAVLSEIDRWQGTAEGFLQFLQNVLTKGLAAGNDLLPRTQILTDDAKFTYIMQRLVITEQGGSSAVGTVELSLGDAYLLQAAAEALIGLGDIGQALGIVETAKLYHEKNWLRGLVRRIRALPKFSASQLGEGLDALIAAVDALVNSIHAIDAETDDQNIELIPRNVIYLTGDWHIPGVLLPTPVTDLLRSLGLNPATLFGGKPMPGALLDFLAEVRSVLAFVRGLLPA